MIKSAAFLVVALLSATTITIEDAIAQEVPVTAAGTSSAAATAGSSATTTLTPLGLPITNIFNQSSTTENGLKTTTTTTTTTEPASTTPPAAVGSATPVVLPSLVPIRPIGSPLRPSTILPAGFPTPILSQ
jgi:hypothetical protein